MNYLGKFINNFRYAYKEINSATLTGAIDVVVVEQPDGTFTCSPFHVRFGKLGVLRSREKIVEIEINGEPLNIYMKLGESGEAFFVEEVDDDISIPEHLICSPIPDSEESGDQELFCSDLNHDEYNHVKKHRADKEQRELVDDDKNADDTEQLQSAIENISSIDDLQINDNNNLLVDNNVKTSLIEGCQKQFTDEQENIATLPKTNNDAALFSANGIILPESIFDNSQNDVYQSLSVSENGIAGVPPEIGFRPIRSMSDSEGYYVTSKDEKDTVNLEGLKVNRKLNSGNVKKRRKKKMRKPASKNHDSLSTNVNNNEDEDKHIVNPNDSHDNTSNQGDDIIEDEIVDYEADLNNQIPTSVISDLHFFSDTEVTTNSSLHERTFSPIQSDTEFEITSRQTEGDGRGSLSETGNSPLNFLTRASWKWGEFPSTIPKSESYDPPADKTEVETKRSALASMLGFMKRTKHIRQKTSELEDGGIYLSQLITSELDPEIARLYLPHSSGSDTNTVINDNKESITHIKNVSQISSSKDDVKDNNDSESGNGLSLIQLGELDARVEQLCDEYTKSDENNLKIDISLCGNVYTNDKVPAEDLFDKHLITYEQFVNDPAIFKNPNVVFRINRKIYKWETACPLILSMALFGKPLPEEILNRLEQERSTSKLEEEKRSHRRGYYSWFNWARSRQHKSKDDTGKTVIDANIKSMEKASIISSKPSSALVASGSFDAEITNIIGEGMELNTPTPLDYDAQRMRTYSSTDSEYEPDILDAKPPERYRKSLRLSSQQIANLNLRDGSNEVVFSVTTAYQGTTRCWCNLFKWRYDDKIVVSDIDGTITKSDVLGHIMPIVGNDWAQNGVARLFNKIKDNGYQLLYLSSRAIGQSKGTRKYLCSIKQEDLTLPEGPLLLNPTSLLSAFHREVIEKKPEKFKISCLRDIQALFPPDSNPFYAGYGNRINDVWAYQAVGIPIFRIFTINHRGELKHELTQTFQSSYTNMSQIADQLFPVQAKRNTAEDYSEFNYWREPLPDVDEGLLKELKIT